MGFFFLLFFPSFLSSLVCFRILPVHCCFVFVYSLSSMTFLIIFYILYHGILSISYILQDDLNIYLTQLRHIPNECYGYAGYEFDSCLNVCELTLAPLPPQACWGTSTSDVYFLLLSRPRMYFRPRCARHSGGNQDRSPTIGNQIYQKFSQTM